MTAPTPTKDIFAKPDFITGGCLCGSIRYKVEFPKDHDFLKWSGTCQCTQCRRNTGALIFHSHTVPLQNLTYLTPTTTLKDFSATPGYRRGFCTGCGSLLYWRDEARDDLELALGCVDPEFLVGGFGFALANGGGHHVFCENEIRGVTEGVVGRSGGTRWVRSSEFGVLMPS